MENCKKNLASLSGLSATANFYFRLSSVLENLYNLPAEFKALNFPDMTSDNHLLSHILVSLSPFSRFLSPVSRLLSQTPSHIFCLLSHIFCLLSISHLLSHVSCLSVLCLLSRVSEPEPGYLAGAVTLARLRSHYRPT